MKVLVLNGSPRRGKSITYSLLEAFLEGMREAAEKADAGQTGETGAAGAEKAGTVSGAAEVLEILPPVNLYDLRIEPCRADFSCWFRTPGHCVIPDDAASVYDSIHSADLVLWSVPLYVFGFPAPVKNLFDRILPWIRPEIVPDSFGYVSHPGLGEDGSKHVLIMSGALPGTEENFGSAVYGFRRIFGKNALCITCAESSLLIYRKSEAIRSIAETYCAGVRKAGTEFFRTGTVPGELLSKLNSLMMPKDEYIRFTNSRCKTARGT